MAGHRARQVAIAGLATALAVGMRAQDAPQPGPTFRSAIDYVQIPVRVLDARGEVVRGLTQSDFQILEDGRPQAITAFSSVEIPSIQGNATPPDAPLSAVEAVASNGPVEVDGRVYVFVLDNQWMKPAIALRTRDVVRGFIRDYLKANDIAAVVFTGPGRGQNFTRNRRLLDDAIGRLMGDADPADDAARRSMATIAETARSMGAIKGRRKALVLMSPSSICSLSEMDQTSMCREDARHALRMAMQSDVSIYTIDPGGLNTSLRSRAEHANPNSTYNEGRYSEAPNGAAARAAFSSARAESRGPDDAARYLAEESGGFAVLNTNSLSAGFERVVRENSSYYLLGYYSTNSRADGEARRNEISVARAGVRVVHRGSYLAPTTNTGSKAGTAPEPSSLEEQLQELANNPLPVSGLPIRIAAAPFASSDSTSSVAVVVEIPTGTLKAGDGGGGGAPRVRLSVGFYDRDGRSVGSADPMLDASDGDGDVLRSVSWIAVPPGVYRLWAAAVQTPAGISGSAMTDIEIPDFRRPQLALSGLTVSSRATPLARREFAADSELFLYGEIYDRRADSGTLRATVRIKSKDGNVVHETPFEPISATAGHQAHIPLKLLGPGTYVATVEVVSVTSRRTAVARSITFTVIPR